MNPDDTKEKIVSLQKEINFHNYRYHVMDEPVISDYEYDMMLKKLQEMEEKYPEFVSPDSPTQRAGAIKIDRFEKVKHPAPILSLANAFNKTDLNEWYERIRKLDDRVSLSGFVLEPKIDGLTVVLHYEKGLFVKGATRGDGEVGEDITANLKTVRSVPLRIPTEENQIVPPDRLVVRGEIFILLTDFEKLNQRLLEAGEKTYQNPRNTAAGSLRQMDPTLTRTRPLTLLTYAVIDSSESLPATQWQTLEMLKQLGFPVSKYSQLVNSIDAVIENVDVWMGKRDQIPFEVDGVVVKLNDLTTANDLGYVGKDPRGAIALKYPAREVTTTLNDIGVNVGRTGVLTPYAILEPVEVGGVVVRQATLHNFDYISSKDIRIKDRILLKRAGDVIPYVIGPITDVRTGSELEFIMPEKCPSCGQEVEHLSGEVAWYCVNSACPAQLIRNLEHFVSRGAMDIEGLGIKIVEQLVKQGLVKDVSDIYRITQNELLGLEKFADKKADNLISAINDSRNRSLAKLIYGLGIRGVGEVAAADLAKNYQNLDTLRNATDEQLQTVEGVGPNTASAIRDWFSIPGNQMVLDKLKAQGIWPHADEEELLKASTPLSGRVIVITGTLPSLSREEAKQKIEQAGGKVTDSVSKNTDFVLVGENAGSKLVKARELGIELLDETAILNLIAGGS